MGSRATSRKNEPDGKNIARDCLPIHPKDTLVTTKYYTFLRFYIFNRHYFSRLRAYKLIINTVNKNHTLKV